MQDIIVVKPDERAERQLTFNAFRRVMSAVEEMI
jgi:hypothetical protein